MITQEQSTQTDRSAHASLRFCGLKLSDVLKLISSLLLPLAFGVFTVVISFEHQRSAKQQRTEDQIAAEQLREQERNLNEERYKNDVFDVYIRDLATLLKDGNGSLTSNKVIANVAQLKSLNIFRQLDPSRNNRIMRFLYETKALTENDDSPALDLSTTKFLNTDFRDLAINKKILNNLSLTGIFLSNATFIGIEMKDINFASTQFDTVDCSLGSLSYINFSSTHWKNANFSSTQLDTVKFSSAELHNINFSLSRLKNVDFGSANLTGIDFSFNQLDTVNFSSAELNNINFSSSHLKNNDFRFATLRNIDFSSTQLDTVDFSFALLLNVSLSYSSLVNAKFSSATAHYVKFSFANLSYADFSRANTSYMDFRQTNCIAARFTYADLSYSSFGKSNAKHAWFVEADLTNVNFSRANLYKAHFVRTNISDDQLQSALSIQGALLSNQTFARDMNLISNGQADCNIFLGNGWTLQTGNITTMASDKDTSDCRFVLQSHNIGAAMLQKIDLSKKWDSKSWSYSQAVLSARMSPSVHIELRGINTYDSVSARETLSSKEDKINLILLNDMRKLEVYIEFNISSNESATSYWCDDIRLYIVYDAYGEFQRIIPHISPSAKWTQNGVTVAGGRGKGSTTDKLNNPHGLFVDDDQTILVADQNNHRIVQWKMGDAKGQVVAGGRGKGSRLDQLNLPTDVLVDKETDRLIICDYENQRVVRWSRQSSTIQGEILIDNIDCFGLVMDDQRNLYVSDDRNYVVWRYRLGDKNGTLVAGGHRKGSGLNEFANLHYIFVDRQQTVYVSDTGNHRVMKWNKGATEGIIVGGGQGQGIGLTDLAAPYGLFVDTLGTLYVADFINNQVKRWLKGETWGTAIVGGDSPGQEANQFSYRSGLSFDRHGNLYVVDQGNNRIQRFSIQ